MACLENYEKSSMADRWGISGGMRLTWWVGNDSGHSKEFVDFIIK